MSRKPLAEWTDDDIRTELLALGESVVPITATTRSFLLKKLEKLLQAANSDGSHDSTEVGRVLESSEASTGTLKCHFDEQEPAAYYVVVVGHGEEDVELSKDRHLCPVYTTSADALKAVKNIPGARFKKFETKNAAVTYWESHKQQDRERVVESENTDFSKPTSVAAEKANNFPSLKTPQLNKFRKLIEEGDLRRFQDSVWENPRYLITSGDTPEILQLGCRYNALHCAVRSRKLDICKELLNIVQGDRFWRLVYSDDSEAVRQTRRDHLLDLYLNMQDKVNRETPLHFACKYGHEDIVALLVSFSCTCQTIKNKYGQLPADMVCKDVVYEDDDELESAKSRIEQLLKEPEIYYVPVLRSVDNSSPPQLFSPCTLSELSNQSPRLNCSTVSSPIVEHALAGPMSPSKARDFYREWRSPSKSIEGKNASMVKRSDPDRGLERVGRKLAHAKGVGWMEYWEFLGCSCDLSLSEGQWMVEEYLKELSDSTATGHLSHGSPKDREDEENPLSLSALNLSDKATVREHDVDGVSVKLFCEGGRKDGVEETSCSDITKGCDIDADVDSLADLFHKNLSFNEETDFPSSSNSNPTPNTSKSNCIFLAGSKPSKLDLDVLRALDGAEPDPSNFPHLHNWLKNVKSFYDQQQKCWHTPTSKKQRSFRSFKSTMESSSQPISPLVFSSPSSSARHNYLSSSARHDRSISGSNSPSHFIVTTPKRQQTQTPGRYFDFRPSPQQR